LRRPTLPPGRQTFYLVEPGRRYGQGGFKQFLTQTLTLTNQTGRDFAFEMVAEDVLIKDGKRIFVAAGETPNSIASSAVFTQRPCWSSRFLHPTSMSALRCKQRRTYAVVAMFRDATNCRLLPLWATASLGSLITFSLDNVKPA
jgi:hypothetical protein